MKTATDQNDGLAQRAPGVSQASRRWPWWIVVGLGGMALTLLLPWFVPVSGPPIFSDSYAVGFSNTAAVAGSLLMAAGLVIVSWKWAPAFLADGRPLWSFDQAPSVGERLVACVVAAVSLVVFGLMCWLTYGNRYGGMGYFLDRSAFVAAGNSPFSALHYPYTILGLYLPVVLWRLFGIAPQVGYFVTYGLFNAVGWYMLYFICGRMCLAPKMRAAVFLSLGIAVAFGMSIEIQYLPIRYLTPLFGILLLDRLLHERLAGRCMRNELAAAAGAGLVLAATAGLSSAEIVLVTCVALCVYLAYRGAHRRPFGFVAPCAFLILSLAGSLALGGGYLALVFSFGAGGYNFPVVPGPMVLLFLASASIVAASVPPLLRFAPADGRALLLGVLAMAVGMVPAAFGRADFSHVFWNGMILFLLAAAVLGRRSRSAFAVLLVLLAGTMVAAEAQYFDVLFKPDLLSAGINNGSLTEHRLRTVAQVLGQDAAVGTRYYEELKSSPSAQWSRHDLDGLAPIAAPLGLVDWETGFYLAQRGDLSAYGISASGSFSIGAAREELARVPRARYLLLPAKYQPTQMPPLLRGSDGLRRGGNTDPYWYSLVLLAYLRFEYVNPQPDLRAFFSDYIWRNYVLLRTVGPYAVWEEKTAASPGVR